MKRFIPLLILFSLVCIWSGHVFGEEGMYPISEIHKLKLQEKGLLLTPEELFNPDGISLLDGICKVGGCSGSFVSPNGLILTNHHCARRAIVAASTKENDYFQNGFLAKDLSEEIPAKGYEVRITESYRDVSKDVLKAVKKKMTPAQRSKAIEKKINEIIKKEEKKNPGMRAEISEMFIGKTYVLFLYTFLKDIRLVHAPPRSIGNFGGDVDNWMWPRHTGDFSYMRAYVGPDGKSADYSPDNVPYKPKRVIKVAPKGVNEGDFVFILGYPGRTYRHRTSHFLSFQEEVHLPYIVDWYQWQMAVMEKVGQEDRAIALKHVSRIKGLANTEKNYRGKLLGLHRMQLVAKKQAEEKAMQEFIMADPDRKKMYGSLLDDIGQVYKEMRERSDVEYVLDYLNRSANLPRFAYTIWEASVERKKKDLDRERAYMDRNFSRTKNRIFMALKDYFELSDKIIFKEILMRAAALPEKKQIPAVKAIIIGNNTEKAIDAFINKAYANTILTDEAVVRDAFTKSPEELKKLNDPFINLAIALHATYKDQREIERSRAGTIDKYHALLIDVKKDFMATDFVPDANSTLRLTYGSIKSYKPRDAITYHPITTADGVLEKTTGEEPFDTPEKLQQLIKDRDFGRFEHPTLKSVPTAILYNMDTTGGNSGSAVLNAKGELAGINFDRAYEATINDYAWSEDYSRSIAVDIRYVLWITHKFGGADHLLKEMGVTID